MPPEQSPVEPDRIPGAPHPREQHVLIGQEGAEREFLEAYRAGRLHHAWLIGGPRGIGKATLAYRIARFLLSVGPDAMRDPRQPPSLTVDPENRASRQVAALSHPNLAVLRRITPPDKKAPTTTIPVDAVRRALSLFGSTAADRGYRVCIVDSAEDLAGPGANALLKLIEEPPSHSVFLIVSHSPRRLLPTIRSRCRRLTLQPLSDADLARVVRTLGPPHAEASEGDLSRAIALSDGSVARAVELLGREAAAAVAEVDALLAGLDRLDQRRVLALAERLSRREAEPILDIVLDVIARFVSAELHAKAGRGADRLAPLAEVCDKAARTAREADAFNLDRRPLVLSLFGDLATAVRSTGG